MSSTTPFPPRPVYVTAVLRGFTLRCPRCGRGKISDGLFKPRPYCTECGQVLKLKEGEFTGGAYIGYGLSIALLGLLFVILVWGVKMDIEQTLWILLPGGVIVPVLLHRHAVGAFTGILIASGAMDEQAPPEAP
ncbi:MAG TPA: DUF983 domain-containing protein [Stenomitos sp.]